MQNKNIHKKILNRKSVDSTNFVFTGINNTTKTKLDYYKYSKDELFFSDEKEFDININEKLNYWINIIGLSDTKKISKLCQKMGVHRLSIQDILDINQRPKFQKFD